MFNCCRELIYTLTSIEGSLINNVRIMQTHNPYKDNNIQRISKPMVCFICTNGSSDRRSGTSTNYKRLHLPTR